MTEEQKQILDKLSFVVPPPKDNTAENNQIGSMDFAKIIRKNIEESIKNPTTRKSRKQKNLSRLFGSL